MDFQRPLQPHASLPELMHLERKLADLDNERRYLTQEIRMAWATLVRTRDVHPDSPSFEAISQKLATVVSGSEQVESRLDALRRERNQLLRKAKGQQ